MECIELGPDDPQEPPRIRAKWLQISVRIMPKLKNIDCQPSSVMTGSAKLGMPPRSRANAAQPPGRSLHPRLWRSFFVQEIRRTRAADRDDLPVPMQPVPLPLPAHLPAPIRPLSPSSPLPQPRSRTACVQLSASSPKTGTGASSPADMRHANRGARRTPPGRVLGPSVPPPSAGP